MNALILVLVLGWSGWALYRKRSRGLIVLLSIFSLIYFGFALKGCICPVGSIQNLADSIIAGTLPLGMAPVLFAIPVVVALFAGRLFCGTACPLGAIQDFLSLDILKMPKVLDRILILLPPVVLYGVIVGVLRGDGYLLCRLDPFVPLFRMQAPTVPLIISVAAVLLSLLVSRPFCRYVCPYGVILGISSLFSKWRVSIEPENNCRSCKRCPPACPVEVIQFGSSEQPRKVDSILLGIAIALLVVGTSFLGGEIATFSQWFFERESHHFIGSHFEKLYRTGLFMGSLVGIAWSLELYTAASPTPVGYTPISHRCVGCARCYNHCPGEIKRVNKEKKKC